LLIEFKYNSVRKEVLEIENAGKFLYIEVTLKIKIQKVKFLKIYI